MPSLLFAGFMPHPPLLVEGVGDEMKTEVARTDAACRQLAKRVAELAPKTVVVVSPHGPVFADAYTMPDWPRLAGDFNAFGSTVSMEWENDTKYVNRASELAEESYLPLAAISHQQLSSLQQPQALDHGTMLPLYYLKQAGWQGKVVCVRIGGLPPRECYRIGSVLAETAAGPTVLIASGDLSHCLNDQAPSPYNPAGPEFDAAIKDALEQKDFKAILDMPPEFRQRAAECGWRPLVTLLGALDETNVASKVLSYEGPFGVGYLVASFDLQPGKVASLMPEKSAPRENSPHARLARRAIEHYLATGQMLPVDEAKDELASRSGAFVSLKSDDQLRGCIGTVEPSQPSLAEEIIVNAVDAATKDPRFEPVSPAELATLRITVDVLAPSQPAGFKDLDPANKGVVVEWRGRRGLLLPDLPGIDDPEEQLSIAMEKGGIPAERREEISLYTFTVERFD